MQISGALEEKKNFFLFFSMKTVETTPKDSKSVSCQVLERPSYYFIFREKSCNRMKKEGGGGGRSGENILRIFEFSGADFPGL